MQTLQAMLVVYCTMLVVGLTSQGCRSHYQIAETERYTKKQDEWKLQLLASISVINMASGSEKIHAISSTMCRATWSQ